MADYTNLGLQANPNQTKGSGSQTLINGNWVNNSSPQAVKHFAEKNAALAKQAAENIKSQSAIERQKAMIELQDQTMNESSGLAAAKVSSAQGSETRGMSRRVHRRRGTSAFAAMGALQKENRDTQAANVNKLFDMMQADQLRKSTGALTALSKLPGKTPIPKIGK